MRLNTVCTKLVDGDHNPPKGETQSTQFLMASSTNINDDTLVELDKVRYLSETVFIKENERTQATKGDIFFTSVGSLGRSCIFDGSINICFQRSVSVLTTLLYNKYLKYFFDCGYYQQKIIKEATGTAQKGFYLNQLATSLIPVPPLDEQKRIVEKIEVIQPYINQYNVKNSEIVEVTMSFPEQLKKAILQEAVRGKLVPQDPSDEPANVLLERIREEKARLIKEGKIKKDKNESVIFRRDNSYYEKSNGVERCIDKELPFEIPNSWEWTRFKNIIIDDKGGGTPDKSNSKYWGGTIPWMSVKDFSKAKNGIIIDTIDHITQEGVNCSSTNVIDSEAIILCTRMGLGKYAKLSRPTAINQDLRAIWLTPNICEKYFLYFYRTLNIVGSGVTVKGIKREDLLETLIPIPPIQEQNRIIRTIDSMIELCNKL